MPQLDVTLAGGQQLYAVGWQLDQGTGWGVIALNLALELARVPHSGALLLSVPNLTRPPHPLHRLLLEPALRLHRDFFAKISPYKSHTFRLDVPLLLPVANEMKTAEIPFDGRPNVGLAVLESTRIDDAARARAARFDRLVVGSRWNEDLLRRHGFGNVTTVHQAVDPTLFHPAPRRDLFAGRFVVFSGGKLEYRKGQDLVIAAFRAFKTRHPDALLLTLWHNPWPAFLRGLELAGHVQGLPRLDAQQRLDLIPWLTANGVAPEDGVHLGPVANAEVPLVLREADVVVCPSRAEGGTNLVAMEAMACGVPTILSANTGHLDLLAEDRCVILRHQGPARPTVELPGVDGWGESSVEEIVEALEWVYQNRDEARRLGARAADALASWTWEAFTRNLRAAIAAPLNAVNDRARPATS